MLDPVKINQGRYDSKAVTHDLYNLFRSECRVLWAVNPMDIDGISVKFGLFHENLHISSIIKAWVPLLYYRPLHMLATVISIMFSVPFVCLCIRLCHSMCTLAAETLSVP